MRDASPAKTYALHIGVIALLFVLNFVLPDYHQGLFARIMALAVLAMGYNLLFGYVGLLSLGQDVQTVLAASCKSALAGRVSSRLSPTRPRLGSLSAFRLAQLLAPSV